MKSKNEDLVPNPGLYQRKGSEFLIKEEGRTFDTVALEEKYKISNLFNEPAKHREQDIFNPYERKYSTFIGPELPSVSKASSGAQDVEECVEDEDLKETSAIVDINTADDNKDDLVLCKPSNESSKAGPSFNPYERKYDVFYAAEPVQVDIEKQKTLIMREKWEKEREASENLHVFRRKYDQFYNNDCLSDQAAEQNKKRNQSSIKFDLEPDFTEYSNRPEWRAPPKPLAGFETYDTRTSLRTERELSHGFE